MGMCHYIKAKTQYVKKAYFLFIVYCANEEKNQLYIGIVGLKHPQVRTLLLPIMTNLEHCCSFVVLDILLFLWPCLTPVKKGSSHQK